MNHGALVNKEALVELLRMAADEIEQNASFEGRIQYTCMHDACDDKPGWFVVRAAIRTGNDMGQGGVSIVGGDIIMDAPPTVGFTERQRMAMRKVLWKISSATSARWDQHLRDEIPDVDADKVIAWLREGLNEMPPGKKHVPSCNARGGVHSLDGLCNMGCAGLASPDVENHG